MWQQSWTFWRAVKWRIPQATVWQLRRYSHIFVIKLHRRKRSCSERLIKLVHLECWELLGQQIFFFLAARKRETITKILIAEQRNASSAHEWRVLPFVSNSLRSRFRSVLHLFVNIPYFTKTVKSTAKYFRFISSNATHFCEWHGCRDRASPRIQFGTLLSAIPSQQLQ